MRQQSGSDDHFLSINQGSFAGIKDGVNTSATQTTNTNGTELDMWEVTSNLAWLTAATPLELVSTSVNDTAAGTGARTVVISGLDINLNTIAESITLNGTTPVQTVNSYFRLQRAFVNACGTHSGTNLGNITIRVTGAGSTQGYIPTGVGRSAKSHFTVPAGRRLIIRSITLVSEAAKPTTFRFYIKGALPVTAPFMAKQMGIAYAGITGGFRDEVAFQIALAAGTDIWATATPTVNNTLLSVDWVGFLVPA